jgi:5-hydroxyisourate hydrolase-like protein (transthyretin family)
MTFFIKSGDNLPVLKAALKDAGGWPLDLTSASSVALRVKQVAKVNANKWQKSCVVTDPANGRVEFRWVTADTAVPGTYDCEFVVTWSDGGTQTVPNNSNIQIVISPSLA